MTAITAIFRHEFPMDVDKGHVITFEIVEKSPTANVMYGTVNITLPLKNKSLEAKSLPIVSSPEFNTGANGKY